MERTSAAEIAGDAPLREPIPSNITAEGAIPRLVKRRRRISLPRQPAFDGSDRPGQLAGGLPVGETFNQAEHDHVAVGRRKPVYLGVEDLSQVVLPDRHVCESWHGVRVHQFVAPSARRPSGASRGPAGDLMEPGAKRVMNVKRAVRCASTRKLA